MVKVMSDTRASSSIRSQIMSMAEGYYQDTSVRPDKVRIGQRLYHELILELAAEGQDLVYRENTDNPQLRRQNLMLHGMEIEIDFESHGILVTRKSVRPQFNGMTSGYMPYHSGGSVVPDLPRMPLMSTGIDFNSLMDREVSRLSTEAEQAAIIESMGLSTQQLETVREELNGRFTEEVSQTMQRIEVRDETGKIVEERLVPVIGIKSKKPKGKPKPEPVTREKKKRRLKL